MSLNLYWEPSKREKQLLNKSLKYVLEKGAYRFPMVFTMESIAFLEGVNCAEVPGAEDLINAIKEHKEVMVTLE